jgi:alkylation response protein AidB-like acyl-CoA dehydrogenase
MISFQLSAEQQEFRDTVRDFVTREVKPVANHPDRLQAEDTHFVPAILEQASQMGLRTLALSEANGGAGADTLTACIVTEELAAGDIGFAATLARTSELGHALFDQAMSDAQRKQFLGKYAEDDNYHLAYAGSDGDPDDGGWNYHRKDKSEVEIPVTAAKKGGDLVLNGSYAFVANAPLAKLIAVQVKTDPKATGLNGAAIVLVPAGTAGMTIKEPAKVETDANGEQVYRWFHGTGGSVTFKDCKVPEANVLAGRSQLFGAAAAGGRGSPLVQALNLGVGRAAYDAAIDYTKIRIQGGRPIIEHQAIGTILAEIALRLETSRNLVWKAAWAADHADEYANISDLPLQTMAKAHTSHAVHEAALLAAECFGAMGVMKDMPLQKYVHDSLIFVHSEMSNATAKLRVAEAIAGFTRG